MAKVEQSKKRQRGFTLIEMIVSVALVAILAASAYSAYNNVFGENATKGKANQVKTDMESISSLTQQYITKNSAAPLALADLTGVNGDMKTIPQPPDIVTVYTWDATTYKVWKDASKNDTVVSATTTSLDLCTAINVQFAGMLPGGALPSAVDGTKSLQCFGASSPYTIVEPLIAN